MPDQECVSEDEKRRATKEVKNSSHYLECNRIAIVVKSPVRRCDLTCSKVLAQEGRGMGRQGTVVIVVANTVPGPR